MFDRSWDKLAEQMTAKGAEPEMTEKSGDSLCRFHKKKNMCFCNNNSADVQETCKHYDAPSDYLKTGKEHEQCTWWNRTETGIICAGWRHCRNPDAQEEAYATPQLQVDI